MFLASHVGVTPDGRLLELRRLERSLQSLAGRKHELGVKSATDGQAFDTSDVELSINFADKVETLMKMK